MTKNEAIKTLRNCAWLGTDKKVGQVEEAIQMAVDALQTDGDAISRQAAIDAVHDEFDDCLVWDESGVTTANEVENILYSVPSVQPVDKDTNVPCTDCVSRQAVLTAIKAADVCVAWNGEISSDDAVDLAVRATKGSVIYSIKALPSVQPEPEIYWGYIPTYERPLADKEIVSRLRTIQRQVGGSYAIDRAIEIIEAVAERRTDDQT